MKAIINVENIKCGGCTNSICKKISKINGILSVDIDINLGQIQCELDPQQDSSSLIQLLKEQLLSMGYPEVGSVEGLKAMGVKAKSFVSCAVGKMSGKK